MQSLHYASMCNVHNAYKLIMLVHKTKLPVRWFQACWAYQEQSDLGSSWHSLTFARHKVDAQCLLTEKRLQCLLCCYYKTSCKCHGQKHFIKTQQSIRRNILALFSISSSLGQTGRLTAQTTTEVHSEQTSHRWEMQPCSWT